MINKIQATILILSLLDLTMSFLYIHQFNKKFPQQDPTIIEANPILKKSMKTFGITYGFMLGALIVFLILILIIFNLDENRLWFLAGVYSMMIIYHLLNFKLLKTT